eukprot:scaffold142686_cov31-Tisochrysis_lutea.AAC.1
MHAIRTPAAHAGLQSLSCERAPTLRRCRYYRARHPSHLSRPPWCRRGKSPRYCTHSRPEAPKAQPIHPMVMPACLLAPIEAVGHQGMSQLHSTLVF